MIPMSAARNGRSESLGLAAAVMGGLGARELTCAHCGRQTRYLLPPELGPARVRHYEWPKSDISDFGWERVTECAACSSRNLPRCSAFRIRQNDAHRFEFIPNTIGLLEILRLARSVPRIDECLNLGLVDASTLMLENFLEADISQIYSKKITRNA